MNVGIGKEVVQFHLWEYINRILGTVKQLHFLYLFTLYRKSDFCIPRNETARLRVLNYSVSEEDEEERDEVDEARLRGLEPR